jgi:hypothetical protein
MRYFIWPFEKCTASLYCNWDVVFDRFLIEIRRTRGTESEASIFGFELAQKKKSLKTFFYHLSREFFSSPSPFLIRFKNSSQPFMEIRRSFLFDFLSTVFVVTRPDLSHFYRPAPRYSSEDILFSTNTYQRRKDEIIKCRRRTLADTKSVSQSPPDWLQREIFK